jgi:hypothetical protein
MATDTRLAETKRICALKMPCKKATLAVGMSKLIVA